MPVPRLRDCDPDTTVSKAIYKRRQKENRLRLLQAQSAIKRLRRPVVVVVEGWDAAGKGGAIRRLLKTMDPRGYRVHSIAKPTQTELDHHYLWRFWTRLPARGEIAVFDRSWYGRVLVERIEGFCTEADWRRAYDEINRFEKALIDDQHVVLKVFMHISKEEQKRRFENRAADPLKSWKLNEEDYRNRKKWERYEEAIDAMFSRTHTPWAPWHMLPANDKRFARMRMQELFLRTVEKAVGR